MAGAYHSHHSDRRWFDIDDEIETIADAIELLEEVQHPKQVNAAIKLLLGVEFVQEELDARHGFCSCADCEYSAFEQAKKMINKLSTEVCCSLLVNVCIDCSAYEDIVTLREAVEANLDDGTINPEDILAME